MKIDSNGVVIGRKKKSKPPTTQVSIFDEPAPHFNGPDYVPELDQKRLSGQIAKIKELMIDGKFRTLGEIEFQLGYPQASISAQLRHLRKPRFGAFTVEKQRRGAREQGLFEYQLTKGVKDEIQNR